MDEIAVELEDLVTSPREVQRVELKSWLDLSDRIVQANVARHIAALANYGGGYLLFGFKGSKLLVRLGSTTTDHHR